MGPRTSGCVGQRTAGGAGPRVAREVHSSHGSFLTRTPGYRFCTKGGKACSQLCSLRAQGAEQPARVAASGADARFRPPPRPSPPVPLRCRRTARSLFGDYETFGT